MRQDTLRTQVKNAEETDLRVWECGLRSALQLYVMNQAETGTGSLNDLLGVECLRDTERCRSRAATSWPVSRQEEGGGWAEWKVLTRPNSERIGVERPVSKLAPYENYSSGSEWKPRGRKCEERKDPKVKTLCKCQCMTLDRSKIRSKGIYVPFYLIVGTKTHTEKKYFPSNHS